MPNLTEYAEQWATTPRTVSRWKLDGAPLGDNRAMRTWLASRKNLPAGTRAILSAENRSRTAKGHDADKLTDLNVGSAAALDRLERAEAQAGLALERAKRGGDAMEIKVARRAWLDVCRELLRYDNAVESTRRRTGEVIQRAECERIVRALGHALESARKIMSAALAPALSGHGPMEISRILNEALYERTFSAIAAMEGLPHFQVPQWATEALKAVMKDGMTNDVDGVVGNRRRILDMFIGCCMESVVEHATASPPSTANDSPVFHAASEAWKPEPSPAQTNAMHDLLHGDTKQQTNEN